MTPENSTPTANGVQAIHERAVNPPEYWRSLEEAAQTDEFQQRLKAEFPGLAAAPITNLTRRNFLQVMGATLALAGVTAGCARQPSESIFPYVKPPEEVLPGKPLYFASAFVSGGYAKGILVESHLGRPTKIEGLPGHPSSLGRTDSQTQASLLDLYDPDRATTVKYRGNISSWDSFVSDANGILDTLRPHGGAGVHLLTETVTSPTLAAQVDAFLKKNPKAVWHQYEPAGRDNVRAGARQAFGKYVDTLYHFDKADVIVSLDADPVMEGPARVRQAHDLGARRDLGELDEHHDGGHGTKPLNRAYAFESAPTNFGATADHRVPTRPGQIEAVARAIAHAVGVNALGSAGSGLSEAAAATVEAVVADLKAHRGKGIVIAGEHQPGTVHALAHAINHALDNAGKTVTHIASVEAKPEDQTASLGALVDAMNAGSVELLLIVGGNPVYTAPADYHFAEALNALDDHGEPKVKVRAHLSRYENETSVLCHWQLAELHYLENWSDARAHDGTVSLVQPLIAPLYVGGKSAHELLSAITDETERTSHEIVQAHWKSQRGENGFDRFWRVALSEGMIPNTGSPETRVSVRQNVGGDYAPAEPEGLEVVFKPDPWVGDGTFSNNAWMQELPKPMSTMAWDNAVLLGHSTANELGLSKFDVVTVTLGDRSVEGTVWVQPGLASGTTLLHLGYGRTRAGVVGNGHGFNAYTLRTSMNSGIDGGAAIKRTGRTAVLATTEDHFNIDDEGVRLKQDAVERRGIVRSITQSAYDADSHAVHHGHHDPSHDEDQSKATLYKPEEKAWPFNSWAMTIDLNKCTGCSACVVACQSENIIPCVGKDELRYGREMHWIRIDRYYQGGDLDNPKTHFQPVNCMQCENAPCEVVCPVGATQHSNEGLNDMVYNRCIGTRYCAANCPYKVRRFNFYNFSRTPLGRGGHVHPQSLRPMRNPNVTLRTRGVMEKCTYCVQRINVARIQAKKNGQDTVAEGVVVTACQQACPSSAITFGNMNNADSAVAKLRNSHRNYAILADLNTRPRTTYLAALTNPNPALEPAAGEAEPHTTEHEA